MSELRGMEKFKLCEPLAQFSIRLFQLVHLARSVREVRAGRRWREGWRGGLGVGVGVSVMK